MSELRKSLGTGALALLPLACCLGLPLLVAAGAGAVALVWGGAVVGGLVLAAATTMLLVRRRARGAAWARPTLERTDPREPVSEREKEVVQR